MYTYMYIVLMTEEVEIAIQHLISYALCCIVYRDPPRVPLSHTSHAFHTVSYSAVLSVINVVMQHCGFELPTQSTSIL